MKVFGSKKTGMIVKGHEVWGTSKLLDSNEYVEITYSFNHVSDRFAFFRIKTEEGWKFTKTESDRKITALKKLGWELLKNKGEKEFLV